MWKQKAAAGMMLLGFTIASYNAYFFIQGLTVAAEPRHIVSTPSFQPEKVQQEAPKEGEQIGVLTIPKLQRSLPIYEGTSESVLRKGVGHYKRSTLPGKQNNAVLSGHRDTVFRQLGQVGKHDLLIVTTEAGEFSYKVKKVRIVDKNDRTVIVPKQRATLTVTTCYPFSFIGDAPKRYVLVAELIKKVSYKNERVISS